jgi:hypothetical protein
MIKALHLICGRVEKWGRREKDQFESGDWDFGAKTAEKFVGARIYLHAKQTEPAWHGGRILKWHRTPHPSKRHKVMFVYEIDGDFQVLCPVKWARWKAMDHSSE